MTKETCDAVKTYAVDRRGTFDDAGDTVGYA